MNNLYKIAIIGRTNSGKSTLFNNLLNKKISAVTKKINTTQTPLKYIFKFEKNKWLLLDAPGLCKAVSILDKIMLNNLNSVIEISDIVWWVVDVNEIWRNEMNIILKEIKEKKKKVIFLINKIDLVEQKIVLEKIENWKIKHEFEKIIPISAKNKINFKNLIEKTSECLKNIKINNETLNTSTKLEVLKEIIREQILLQTNDEVPYFTTLKIIDFFEDKNGIFTNIEIIVNNLSKKKIIIGKGGSKIKLIRLNTVHILKKIWNKKITIFINVKIIEKWYQNPKILQEIQFKWN